MQWILFFDGDCGFCKRMVGLVARLDKRGVIRLEPLQGELGRELGFAHHAEDPDGTMVVFRECDRMAFLRSDALFEIAAALGGGWRIFGVFRLVPRRVRDFVYRWIAKNRGRFGLGRGSC